MTRRTKRPKHSLFTRLWHWLTAAAVIVLLLSGLAIFNAHPRLYWGSAGAHYDPAWLEIWAEDNSGFVRVNDMTVETTGFLGFWTTRDGQQMRTAFPAAVTLPSPYALAGGRNLHLAVSWALIFGWPIFIVVSLATRHLQRDLLPGMGEMAPGHMVRSVADHCRRRPHDQADHGIYNILQKLTYLIVYLVLLPGIVLSGLAMSPAMAAAWPWLLDLFGGRQSARSVHFLLAGGFVAFIVIHLGMLLFTHPVRLTGEMLLGGRRADQGDAR